MIIIVVLIYGFFFAFSNKAKGYFYGNAIGQTYDLGDYPMPFVNQGGFHIIGVVGDKSEAEDTLSLSNVLTSLQFYGNTLGLGKESKGMSRLSSEITDIYNENIISIGNACNNSITDEILGNPTVCSRGLEAGIGKIIIKSLNGKTQLIIEGGTSTDRRNAANVLANWQDYDLDGDCIEVTKAGNIFNTVRCSNNIKINTFNSDEGCFNVTKNVVDGKLIINRSVTFCKDKGIFNFYHVPKGIEIAEDNIVLDCNQSIIIGKEITINGDVSKYNGITLEGVDNVKIENCIVSLFKNGIVFRNSNSNIIKHNGFSGDENSLIFENSVNNELKYNKILVKEYSNIYFSKNRIYNNQTDNMNISLNYFETINESLIEKAIYDNKNESSLGNIFYNPTLCSDPLTQCFEDDCLKCCPNIDFYIPTISIEYGREVSIDFSEYIHDDDSPDEDISLSVSDNEHTSFEFDGMTAKISAIGGESRYDMVTLNATDQDGLSDTSYVWIQIGDPVNGGPEIISTTPDTESIILEVNEEKIFNYSAIDPENDTLIAFWKLDNGEWEMKSDFRFSQNNVGSHKLELVVSDGEINVSNEWSIDVQGINSFPVLVNNIPDQDFIKDDGLSDAFDLDDYFSDPDDAKLKYSPSNNKNIDITIDFSNNQVSFNSVNGWTGTQQVYFVANDGQLIKRSNNLTITIREMVCVEDWTCTDWRPTECPHSEIQTRSCEDIKRCGTTKSKPKTRNSCVYVEEETPKTHEEAVETFTTNNEDYSGDQNSDKEELLSPSGFKLNTPNMLSILFGALILGGLFGVVAYETTKSKKKLDKEKKSSTVNDDSLAKLMDYIRREINEGKKEQEIRTKLLFEGWNEYIVDKAFSNLESFIEEAHGNDNIDTIVRKHVDEKVHERFNEKVHEKMNVFD